MESICKENYKKGCVAFIDGASLNNPGNAGIGAVIFLNGEKKLEISRHLGIKTNNEAEYSALLAVLEALVSMGIKRAKIFSDSRLLVSQINGQYKVKAKNIISLHQKAISIIKSLEIEIIWIPREENSIADALSKQGAMMKI